MAQKKKIEPSAASAMPETIKAMSVEALFDSLVKEHNFKAAYSLVDILGEELIKSKAPVLLEDLVQWTRWGGSMFGDRSMMLDWGEKLMSWGADPFAFTPKTDKEPKKPSYFEVLVRGGFWAYATSMAKSSPEAMEQAQQVAIRINQRELSWKNQSETTTELQEKMIEEGADALSFGFTIGLDPNVMVRGQPWVFSCKNVEMLRQFVKAGVNAAAKNSRGQTMSEAFASIEGSRARQEMQDEARRAQNLSATPLDPASSSREAFALARAGSWREIKKAAKGGDLNPLTMKNPEGGSLLAVAIGNSNWVLVGELLAAGADPRELTPVGQAALPTVARAFGVGDNYFFSSLKATAAKLTQASLVREELMKSVDYSWRDAKGQNLLEAFKEVMPKNERFNNNFVWRWLKGVPLDPSRPLWSRVGTLLEDSSLARRCAAERRSEPWMDGDKSLMGFLLMSDAPDGYVRSRDEWKYQNEFKRFIESIAYGEARCEALECIFAPEQWEGALRDYWTLSTDPKCSREKIAAIAERFELAMTWRIQTAKNDKLEEPFDFDRIGKAIVAGYAVRVLQGGKAVDCERVIRDLGTKLCLAYPEKAGAVLLDILGAQTSKSTEIGYAIWTHCKDHEMNLILPESHPIMEKSGGLLPELANHPIWREIEESVVAKAAVKARKIRL